MILELRLPLIVPQMLAATVECLHAGPGEGLQMGSKLVDLSVDLSSAFAQECPPISYYRMVLRERATLRAIALAAGDKVEADGLIALFSSDPEEPLDQPPSRPLRVAIAGIMHHEGMISGNQL